MTQKDFKVKHGLEVNGNAFIANSITSVDSIQLDLANAIVDLTMGQISWNEDANTVSVGLGVSSLELGQEEHVYIKNQSGNTIGKGNTVMFSGTIGNSGRLLGTKAVMDGTFPSSYFIGVAKHDIANGEDGYVTTFGKIDQVNTSMFSEGDILYANPTVAGGLSNVAPIAPNNYVTVAAVVNADANNGVLFVRPTYEGSIADKEDVYINGITNNSVLVWSSANSRFEARAANSHVHVADDIIAGDITARIPWADTNAEAFGNYLGIGGYGSDLVLASGEARGTFEANNPVGTRDTETLWLLSDQSVRIVTGLQNTWSARVDAVTITNTGDVGIGTTSPGARLEVIEDAGSLTSAQDLTARFRRSDGTYNPRLEIRHSNTGTDLRHTYSTIASNFTFSIVDTERMRITADGNIGIGTSNPASLLHVSSGTAGDAVITIEADTDNNDESDNPRIEFKQDGGLVTSRIGMDANNTLEVVNEHLSTGSRIALSTQNTQRVIITADGNVGVGITSPTQKLDMTGAARIRGASSASDLLYLGQFSDSAGSPFAVVSQDDNAGDFLYTTVNRYGATHSLRRNSAGGSGVRMMEVAGSSSTVLNLFHQPDPSTSNATNLVTRFSTDGNSWINGGNVGIGTNTPTSLLHVGSGNGPSSINTGNSNFISPQIVSSQVSNSAAIGVAVRGGSDERRAGLFLDHDNSIWGLADRYALGGAYSFIVTNSGTERLRLAPDGNFGIGTSSPGQKLDVNGSVVLSGADFENRVIEIGAGRTGNGASFIDFVSDTTYSDYGLRILRGAGTNSTSTVEQRGTGPLILRTREAAYVGIQTSNTERVRITAAGDVGIGTTSPATKLDVHATGANGINLGVDPTNSGLSGRLFFTNGSAGKSVAILNKSNNISFSTSATPTSSSGTERMVITDAGRVGIGTTNPTTLLDVRGDVLSYQNGFYVEMSSNGPNDRAGMEWLGTGTLGFLADSRIQFQESDSNTTRATFDLNNSRFRFGDANVAPVNTFEVAGNASIEGSLTVSGNLTISGTTTTINTETLNVADNIIALNSNYTGSTPTESAGIEINRGTLANAILQWNETSDYWEIASGGTTGRILTVSDEGTGNGLDADTVDGLQASQFLRSDISTQINSTAPVLSLNDTDSTNTTNQVSYISFQSQDTEVGWVGYGSNGNSTITLRNTNGNVELSATNGNATVSGNRILTTADEGTGNGLDADTVDGLQASQFLRSDASDIMTGSLTVSNGAVITDEVRTNNGNYLIINAGESHLYATGQTGEKISLNAESGIEIISSPDNWASGWAGRQVAYINDNNAASLLPGVLTVAGATVLNDILEVKGAIRPDTSNLSLGLMPTFQGTGTLRITRRDGAARYHDIIVNNDSTAAANYFAFNIHNGTVDSTSEVMRLRGDGNVGIGTTSPQKALHVVGDGRFNGNLELSGTNTENRVLEIGAGRSGDGASFIDLTGDTTYSDYGLRVLRSKGANGASVLDHRGTGSLVLRSRDAGLITFETGLSERMRVTSTGNVGIGTPAPLAKFEVSDSNSGITSILGRGTDANFRLVTRQNKDTNANGDIVGEVGVDFWGGADYTRNSAIRFHRGGSGSSGSFLSFATDAGTERVRINAAGRVGVNTTNPQTAIHINQADQFGLRFERGGHDTIELAQTGSARFSFVNRSQSNREELVIAKTSGNIGIGTNAPSEKLTVANSIGITGSSYPSLSIRSFSDGLQPTIIGTAYRGTEASPLAIANGYRLLDIHGRGYNGNAAPYTASHISISATEDFTTTAMGSKLSFSTVANGSTSGAIRMTIDQNGYVGIGTTTPNRRLHVNEDVNGEAGIRLSNPNTGTGAASVIRLNNDSGTNSQGLIFLNGANRVGDGDANTMTIRNNIGDLRLQATGSVGMHVKATTGKVGIGTASPTNFFHVRESGTDTYGSGIALFEYYDTDNTTTRYQASLGSAQFANFKSFVTSSLTDFLIVDQDNAAGRLSFQVQSDAGAIEGLAVESTGNVGIGTTTPAYKLEVNGSFAATTKSFVIDHPTKPDYKLRYGSLEGPENGVYVRGKLIDSNVIELPDYWTGLVDEDSITVQLTAFGSKQDLWVVDIKDNKVYIEGTADSISCFYLVQAERKDVEKLIVEYEEGNSVDSI